MKWLIATLGAGLLFGSAHAQEKEEAGNTLKDVVIKGEVEVQYEEEKPPLHIEPDFNRAVEMEALFSWQKEIGWFPEPPASVLDLDLRLSGTHAAFIAPAPVKVFQVDFPKLSKWELTISTSGGELYRSLSGSGSPPSEIAWDGVSDSGTPSVPGARYVYNFTAVDRAGNKRTLPGQPFSVNSYYLHTGGKLTVAVAASDILAVDGFHLAAAARGLAEEVASLMRFYARHGKIEVVLRNNKIESFVGFVAEALAVTPTSFSRTSGDKALADAVIFFVE